MAPLPPMSRRSLFRFSLLTAGVGLLGACAPQPPAPAPTSAPAAPARPTEAPKPAAPAATTAPAAAAPAATQPSAPAAAPTAAAARPAAPAPKPAAKEPALGSHLIGKLEGPTIQPEAKRPPKLGEAPMLAELVKAGKLPPVEQRVPEEPLVIKPLHEIGTYGGTWRRAFTGPGDGENGNRIMASDKLVFADYTGAKQNPSIAKGWEVSDGNRTFTFFLRKGHKWSDGHPFTADDILFWYEDLYQNKDLTPTPTAELSVNGKPGTIEKVDDLAVRFTFQDPYPTFMEIIGGSTYIGSSQDQSGGDAPLRGPLAPKHYLSQFLPKYAGLEKVDAQAKAAGFDNWKTYFTRFLATWRLNVDLPFLGPWKTITPINTPNWVLERNPYYYVVDTDGNQLPYFDKISMTLAENLEVVNLRAIAGEYDSMERHTDLGKLPVFLENQEKGGYTIRLDPVANGADAALHLNQGYQADAEIGKWLRNRDFRRALSMGIDRDQLNEVFWLGVGTPGTVVPSEEAPYSPGGEWRTKWSNLDLAQANALLDKIGLDKKDSEGFRLRTDNGQRLRLELTTVGGSFIPFPKIGEMIAQQVRKIGIQLDATERERSLADQRRQANEQQILIWQNGGSELLWAYPQLALPTTIDSNLGPEIGKWYASNGSSGRKPEDPQLVKALELFRAGQAQEFEARIKTAHEIWQILADEAYSIGTVGLSPATLGVRVVKNNVGNSPARQMNANHCRTPGSSHPATFYFKS